MKVYRLLKKRIIACFMVLAMVFSNANFYMPYKQIKASETRKTKSSAYYTPTEKEKSDAKAEIENKEKEISNAIKSQKKNSEDEIYKELKENRTANSNTYLLTNGKKQLEIFSEKINYKKNGKYYKYKPELEQVTNDNWNSKLKEDFKDYSYVNKAGDSKQFFPTNLNDNKSVVMSKKDYVVKMYPTNLDRFIYADSSKEMLSDKSKSEDDLESTDTVEETDENDESESQTDEITSLEQSNQKVDINLNIKSVNKNSISYSNDSEDIEFNYTSLNNGVKEEIVLNQKPKTNVIEFRVDTSNLIIKTTKFNKEIRMYDRESNKLVSYISEPLIIDSKGNAYYDFITYKVKEENIVQIVIDEDYLNSKEAKYPLTIDPTVIWAAYGLESATVYNFPYTQSVNMKNTSSIQIHNKGISFYPYSTSEEMCYIDTSGIDYNNGLTGTTSTFYGSKVTSAYLYLTEMGNTYTVGSNGSGTFTPGYVDVKSPSSTWSPYTITWNNHPSLNSQLWAQFQTTGVAYTHHSVNVTDWASAVASRSIENTGLALKMTNEGTGASFYSSSLNNQNYMRLTIIYEDPRIGYKDIFSYEDVNLPNGSARVEVSEGNLMYEKEDFSLQSPNLSPNVTRTYNSRKTEKGIFGIGWTCEYDATIINERGMDVTYCDGTGAIYVFEYTVNGTLKCGENSDLVMDVGDESKNITIANYNNGQPETISVSSHIRITDKEKVKRYFTLDGKLRLIEDASGNFIYVKYHSTYGRLHKIYSKQGQVITFTFTSNNNGDHFVSGTSLSNGEEFEYTYSNDRLTKATHIGTNNGTIEYKYHYGSSGKMDTITDAKNNDYEITYYQQSVSGIEYPNGDKIGIFVYYAPLKTLITERNDNAALIASEFYEFDAAGKCLKKTDKDGKIIDYSYSGSLETGNEEEVSYYELQNNNVVKKTTGENNCVEVLSNEKQYNSRENVTRETDEEGNVTEYTYGDFTNPDLPTLVQTTNAQNEITSKIKYEYNSLGQVVKESDFIEKLVTTYTYDSSGNEIECKEVLVDANTNMANVTTNDIQNGLETSQKTSAFDAFGNELTNQTTEGTIATTETNTYTFDDLGRVSSSQDEKGITTAYTYDQFGRVKTTVKTYPNSQIETTEVNYDANDNHETETDNYGRVTTYQYDDMGRVVSKILTYDNESKETTTSYGYEENIYIITGTGTNKYYSVLSTVTEYNESEEIVSKKYSDAGGRVVREEDLGIVKDYTFDGQGNVFSVYERGVSNINQATPKLTISLYDKNGKLTNTIINPSYDTQQHCYKVTNASLVTYNEYDNAGNLISERDCKGNETTYEYNAEGKLTKVSLPDGSSDGNHTLYSYDIQELDPSNRVISTKNTTTNALGKVSENEYNGGGQLLSTTDIGGTGSQIKTFFEYDSSGNKSKETHQDGGYITYSYNDKNQMTESREYNANDVVQKKTTYSYNTDGQIEHMVEYKRVSGSQQAYRHTIYEYDDFGKTTGISEVFANSNPSENVINSHKLKYKYDIEDKLTEIRYPLSSGNKLKGIKLEYNGYKWLTTIKAIIEENNDEVERNLRTYDYYNDSRVKTIKDYRGFLDGTSGYIKKNYSYDIFDRVTEMKYKDSSNLNAILEKHTYTYDKNSNILSETYINNYPSNRSDKVNETRVYTYDNLNRLKTSKITNNNTQTEKNATYTYDKVGNITKVEEDGVVTDNYYTAYNQLSNSLKTENGIVTERRYYQYDSNGNQITEQVMTNPPAFDKTIQKEYDINNQLTKVTYRNGNINGTIVHEQENLYNAAGKRIIRKDDGVETRFFYQGDTLLYTTDTAGNKKSQNIVGPQDNIIATVQYSNNDEDSYIYNKDIRTSVTNIVDDSGAGVVRYKYSDFGETTKQGNTSFYNEIAYTSGVYDELTELYYLNARFYNPETESFITQDTYRGEQTDYSTWNLYAYCGGNPINCVDPSGHKCYTFSISQFKTESKGIRKVLQDKYNLKSKNSVLKITNNHNSFKKAWNSMKGKIKCLVINMHGNPFEIGTELKTIMSIKQIKRLKKKSIKKMILLPCNAGHQDWLYDNVAHAFSKKIKGSVIASDGTVSSCYSEPAKSSSVFSSKADEVWKKYVTGVRKKNVGWVKYLTPKALHYSYRIGMTMESLLNY